VVVEVEEALQRILLVHRRLILVLVLLGLLAGFALHLTERPVYAASTRVVLGSPDPQDAAESQALADGARAIVTSPAHVAAALDALGVSRDPATVARDDVDLQALGTSGTMELTVRDGDPHVAARLANAIATDLIATRLQIVRGASAQTLNQQAAALRTKLDQVDAQIGSLQGALATATPAGLAVLSSELASWEAERTSILQQISALQAEPQQSPMVVDPALAPDHPVPSRRPLDMALGALLGLVVGVAAAALAETLRPTVMGARAVARVVGAPVLGELNGRSRRDGMRLSAAYRRLRLATRDANVGALELVGPGPAEELEALSSALVEREGVSRAAGAPALRVVASSGNGTVGGAQVPTGVVLVARPRMKRADLAAVAESISLTDHALLGVLTIRKRLRPERLTAGSTTARRPAPEPARSEKEAEVG
jgi:uncharacterized protein involved in exopolysaccharide biosynthesis